MPAALYRRGDTVCYGERGGAYVVVNAWEAESGWLYDLASASGRMGGVSEKKLRPESGDRRYMERPEETSEPWLQS